MEKLTFVVSLLTIICDTYKLTLGVSNANNITTSEDLTSHQCIHVGFFPVTLDFIALVVTSFVATSISFWCGLKVDLKRN